MANAPPTLRQDGCGYGQRRPDHQRRSHSARHPRKGGYPAAPAVRRQGFEAAKKEGRFFATGVNASPGAAVGQIYFDADTAERMAKEEKQDVIMVRPFTKPDDVHGMLAAKGILTSEGGATSHAAVVARQFGVPCVVGASSVNIDLDKRQMECNGDRRQRRRMDFCRWHHR